MPLLLSQNELYTPIFCQSLQGNRGQAKKRGPAAGPQFVATLRFGYSSWILFEQSYFDVTVHGRDSDAPPVKGAGTGPLGQQGITAKSVVQTQGGNGGPNDDAVGSDDAAASGARRAKVVIRETSGGVEGDAEYIVAAVVRVALGFGHGEDEQGGGGDGGGGKRRDADGDG